MGTKRSRDATTADAGAVRTDGGRELLIISAEHVRAFELPETGTLLLGRAEEATLVIDDDSVSRRHATLSVGPRLTIADLGSRNGTRVRGAPLAQGERAEVELGETFEVGFVRCFFQRRLAFARLPRVWAHDAFDARLEKACSEESPFALLFLRVRSTADSSAIQKSMLEATRVRDVLARTGPRAYEAIVWTDSVEARDFGARALAKVMASLGADAEVGGWADYPTSGRTAAELRSRAWDALLHGDAATSAADDQAMRGVMKLVEKVASSPLNVLVHGETGVGKEVIAERIHELSPRRDKPYVRVNCAALTESLFESELFGHERGAFTGAVQSKPGLLEAASGGTLLLDEIGELPLPAQAKLLRVVEERQVTRVGGVTPRPIDVRVLAATNRDLEAEAQRGTFRADLYFRLSGVTVLIPPLRERVSEIAPLAATFAAEGTPPGLPVPTFTPEALDLMRRYAWPGNIRELRNVVLRAVMLSEGERMLPEHLPVEQFYRNPAVVERASASDPVRGPSTPSRATSPPPAPSPRSEQVSLRAGIEDYERERIVLALEKANGNQSEAARALGISRGTLISRLAQFNLPRPRKKGAGD